MAETARELEFFFGTEVEYQEALKESQARNQALETALRRLMGVVDAGYLVSVNYAPAHLAYPGLKEAANAARAALEEPQP